MKTTAKKFGWWGITGLVLAGIVTVALLKQASAQDYDDPPGRVARLGYMQGSVSFQPAGETDWVGAVPNRPMTTGDQLWTDQDSRAEVQLGSAVVRLAPNTGFSFINLDDNTVQIQLTSGAINVTVRRLEEGEDFEVDTPNLAFVVFQPGHYRLEAGTDGNYTAISIRAGEGEATGNGQNYSLHAGQRATFSGTEQLYADVEEIGGGDGFDAWSEERDHRYDYSRSAQYLSHDVVGFDDLDEYGDWRNDGEYGHVWFPNRVEYGWAPYHEGHWDWISPWGWTWVDDSPWGYAPFHYGRWVSIGGRWGWVAGPVAVQPVYAPALVVFVGGGPGGFGGNVGWFPLGPREVYVPSYRVSEAYVTRVNVSSTTVNVTQVTNIYHTTTINNTTNITNVTYVNRNVQGAVMVVPQHAFVSAQPVAKAAVAVNAREIAAAPVTARVAVAPTRESVLGAKAATVGHVTAPPAAIANRQVVAKKTPPPPPVPFAKQQQALAAHPGQPLAKNEVQSLRPAAAAAARPMVKVAPPGKPATAATGHPAPPANMARPAAEPSRPAATPQPNNRPAPAAPANRPENRPAAEPNRPAATPPMNRPAEPSAPNRPAAPPQPENRPPANRPEAAPNRPEPSRPAATPPMNRPAEPSAPNRPAAPPQPENRPPANRPEAAPNRPEPSRPPAAEPNNRPEPNRNEPAPRPQTPPATERPQPHTPPPAAAKPAPLPQKQQPKPQTPEEKKKQEEKKPQ